MKQSVRNDWKMLARALKMTREMAPGLIPCGALSAVFSAIYPFLSIYLSALLVDRLKTGDRKELIFLAGITVGTNAICLILSAAFRRLYDIEDKMFYQAARQVTGQKTMELDYERLTEPETHEKLRLLDDMHEITGMRLSSASHYLLRLLERLIKMAVALVLISGGFAVFGGVWYTWLFFGLILLLIAVSVALTSTSGRRHFDLYEKMLPFKKYKWYYDREYLDTARTGREIRIFAQQKIIGRDYDRSMDEYQKLNHKMGTIQGRFNGATAVCSVIAQGAIYFYVGLRALSGSLGIGSVVRFGGYIGQLYEGVQGFLNDLVGVRQIVRWLRAFWDFYDSPGKQYEGTIPTEKRGDCNYVIEFRNVSFRYPGAESCALKNVSFRLQAGERLALVGRNGSGKTTFIKLLCRMYDPTEGEITLNGIDIRKYNPKEYRALFSVVFQDFRLFSFTLGQNVAAARDYDREKAVRCCEMAGLSSVDTGRDTDKRLCGERGGEVRDSGTGNINSDSMRPALELDSYLYNNFGEAGVEISGGEEQKIALARALYKEAPFLVLDEPTAALDPAAEFEIYSRFHEIAGEKTALYISHRLASCRFCDEIAVFDQGKIVQRGSHEVLISEEDKMYYSLWNAQAQYYAECSAVPDAGSDR